MPEPPGLIDKVNYTIDFIENPCDAPWFVYVETAGPAALIAVEMLTCFDWLDVFRMFFRPVGLVPRGARGRGHRRGRGRRRLGTFRRLARTIPGVKAIQGRKLSQGAKALWRFDGFTQRLLWWWLMADVAGTFLYNWTTLLNKSEYCQMQNAPGAGMANNGGVTITGLVGWNAVLLDNIDYERGSVDMTGTGFGIGSAEYEIILAADVTNAASTNITQTFNIRALGSVSKVWGSQTGDEITVPWKGSGSLVHRFRARGPGSFALQVFVDQSGARVEHATVVVIGIPAEPPPFDNWECKDFGGIKDPFGPLSP